MSVLQDPGFSVTRSEEKPKYPTSGLNLLSGYMLDKVELEAQRKSPSTTPLNGYRDARAIVRLVQCPQCSKPLQLPVTLPCGHTYCRSCLSSCPPSRPCQSSPRSIVHPNDVATVRRQFHCSETDCGWEFVSDEYDADIALSKVIAAITAEINKAFPSSTYTKPHENSEPSASFRHKPQQNTKSKSGEPAPSSTLGAGRLAATFHMAESGQLDFASDEACIVGDENEQATAVTDDRLLSKVRDVASRELDCYVCYNLMLDPTTTPCGHTFCRKCLARVLDHSPHCPLCRRNLPIPPSLERQPSNHRLVTIIKSFWPDLVQIRAETVAREERSMGFSRDVSLFICTLSFPGMPTFLHIFEPRYRLMVRRALGHNRQFGMLMYNQSNTPQGALGNSPFVEYGTMLEIVTAEVQPDGRSYLETRGLYRFRVCSSGNRDGYTIGDIERVDDDSTEDEERCEAEEMRQSHLEINSLSSQGEAPTLELQLSGLTNGDLLLRATDFVQRMQRHSAPWISQRVVAAYGVMPTDAASFPYWFASALPIAEEEKYALLRVTNVRQRLKMVNVWIDRIENQQWLSGSSSCTIL